jgi:hypothetical protein
MNNTYQYTHHIKAARRIQTRINQRIPQRFIPIMPLRCRVRHLIGPRGTASTAATAPAALNLNAFLRVRSILHLLFNQGPSELHTSALSSLRRDSDHPPRFPNAPAVAAAPVPDTLDPSSRAQRRSMKTKHIRKIRVIGMDR